MPWLNIDFKLQYAPTTAPCENVVCKNTTDTCSLGTCHCGESHNLKCNPSSEFPLCFTGACVCSKTKGLFIKGDGTTQGSCHSRNHKCQSNGLCLECTESSQCSGLSDTCKDFKCGCGDIGFQCNSTISNLCSNGQCWCGRNPQCSQTVSVVSDDSLDCASDHCDYDPSSKNCMNVRTDQEVCEKITSKYNPLYVPQKIMTTGGENALICDDRRGKHLGEYMCLGKV